MESTYRSSFCLSVSVTAAADIFSEHDHCQFYPFVVEDGGVDQLWLSVVKVVVNECRNASA